MLEPGDEIAGLRVVGEVGRGTTSLVFEARSATDADPVAVKLLMPGLADDPVARRRFLRGAEAQASLDSPGIVPVLDRGEDKTHGPYVVMPLYRGGSLADRISGPGVVPAELLDLIEPAAAGLDAAHAAGVVHRDIKPSNILLDGGRAALADFGLAREEGDSTETVTGGVIGTLTCIAPEVVAGRRATPASDRYGFAAVIVEALTGSTVFPRTSDAAVLYAHAEQEPPSLKDRRGDLPEEIDRVIGQALAKDPSLRPASAVELVGQVRQALGDRLEGLPAAVRHRPASGNDETLDPAGSRGPAAPGHSRAGRRKRPAIAIAALLLVAVLAVVFLPLGDGDDSTAAGSGDLPELAEGHVSIGSDLSAEGMSSTDCNGRPAGPNSPACTVMQLKLPGRAIQVPSNGAIRSWTVRGAEGELALQVLRERDGKFFQLFRSQSTVIPDTGISTHEVELAVSAGDYVSLAVSPDTAVGIRKNVDGARTNRFFGPVGPDVRPSRGPGSGFDHELLLRVDYEPGGIPVPPEQVFGDEARSLPDGKVVAADDAALPDGRIVKVFLTEVGDEVFVDLERGGVRQSRILVPDLEAGGRLVEFEAYESPGNPSQLNVGWLNEGDRRPVQHYFGLDAAELEFYS